jgi:hypothetical protein
MTDALAALGVCALVASGQFTRTVNIAVSLGLILAVALRETWRQELANKHADAIAVFALATAQLGRALFTGASVLDVLIEFAVGLQIIRVATRKGAAHDQQVIVLALLHLIAGTVVGGGLGYGLCFFGLLVVTPGALVLSHLRREVEGNYRQGARDRTGLPVDVPRILRSKRVVGRQFIAVTCLLSVPILLFTVSLFVVFPRVGLSLLLLNRPKGGRMIGFSGKVDLGQIGTLRTDPTIALRVTPAGLPNPPPPRIVLHMRGTALDHYDGRSWTQTLKSSRAAANGTDVIAIHPAPMPPPDEAPTMRVELEPIDPPVLFLPPDAKALRLLGVSNVGPGPSVSVHRGPEGEYRYQAPSDRGLHYEVYRWGDGQVSFPHLRSSERERYLQLPDDLPARIKTLAETWVDGVNGDMARAKLIEQRLRSDFAYDLSSPSGAAEQPLDDFLFKSRRGHCEYYSTAMAVMLRTLGVPTRNVTGFIGGTFNKYGEFYAVRQGDAHSWVEVFIEGRGWLTFDPTPPGSALPQTEIDGMLASMRDFFEAVSQRWNQHVLNYDLRQQVSLFESLSSRRRNPGDLFVMPSGRAVGFVVGVGIALASAWWWFKRRRRGERGTQDIDNRRRTRDEVIATKLYQGLDRSMALIGVARSTATPPLRHARMLTRAAHPLADEIMSLTQRYLTARFGDEPLAVHERRDFEDRVRKLREAPRTEVVLAGPHDDDADERPPPPAPFTQREAAPVAQVRDDEPTDTVPAPPPSHDQMIGLGDELEEPRDPPP